MTEIKLVHNAETGEITEVELTAAEIAQNLKDSQAAQKVKERIQMAQAARESAVAKLEAIGLTAEEIAALRA
jgi:DNA-binding NarL/FixJ family response regulator